MNIKMFIPLTISTLMLIGCSDNSVDNSGKNIETTETSTLLEAGGEDTQITEEPSEEIDEKLVTDGPLLEVGQYKNDEYYGRLELNKIINPGNEHEVASGVFVTFGDVKLINFKDIPEGAQEDAEIFYGFQGNQGYDLQFDYTVENRNDFKIFNAIVEKIILSDGEQIERYMYADESFELEAGSKASNQVGHVSIPTDDIDSVTFYINPFDDSNYEEIDSQPIKVMFQ